MIKSIPYLPFRHLLEENKITACGIVQTVILVNLIVQSSLFSGVFLVAPTLETTARTCMLHPYGNNRCIDHLHIIRCIQFMSENQE